MRSTRTHADLQAFLNRDAAPLEPSADADLAARIQDHLRIAAEDLEDAREAEGRNHASSALNNMEEAVMICGEVVALALGYKLRDESSGFHARAIECLVLYAEVFDPKLAIYARRFQSLRAARRTMKYDRVAPGEAQLKQFLTAADAFFQQFKDEPAKILARRRAQRPAR
jgi:hypothetical protein